jgi:chromosome segregation ATPase
MSTDEGEIESLRKEMRDLREWVDEIYQKLDRLCSDHAYLDEQVNELDGRVGRIADRTHEAFRDFEKESRQDLREQLKDLRDDLNDDIKDLRDDRNDLNTEIKELRADLNSAVKNVREHLDNQLRIYFRP